MASEILRPARSLQDLRHIRAELQLLREQEKAREQALAEQRRRQHAERNQFAVAVGKVQALRGDHALTLKLSGVTPAVDAHCSASRGIKSRCSVASRIVSTSFTTGGIFLGKPDQDRIA